MHDEAELSNECTDEAELPNVCMNEAELSNECMYEVEPSNVCMSEVELLYERGNALEPASFADNANSDPMTRRHQRCSKETVQRHTGDKTLISGDDAPTR